jgi:hypothetical protein
MQKSARQENNCCPMFRMGFLLWETLFLSLSSIPPCISVFDLLPEVFPEVNLL